MYVCDKYKLFSTDTPSFMSYVSFIQHRPGTSMGTIYFKINCVSTDHGQISLPYYCSNIQQIAYAHNIYVFVDITSNGKLSKAYGKMQMGLCRHYTPLHIEVEHSRFYYLNDVKSH